MSNPHRLVYRDFTIISRPKILDFNNYCNTVIKCIFQFKG